MAYLDNVMIVGLILHCLVVNVLVLVLLVGLRAVFRKRNTMVSFTNLSLGKLILMVMAASVVVAICLLLGLNIYAAKDIAGTVKAIRSCSHLSVQNDFYSALANGDDVEKLRVSDPQAIERLARTIEDGRCKLMWSKDVVSTQDCVDVVIYKDDIKVGWFRIIAGLMETGAPSDFRRYKSSDRHFSDTVRKAIGAKVNE